MWRSGAASSTICFFINLVGSTFPDGRPTVSAKQRTDFQFLQNGKQHIVVRRSVCTETMTRQRMELPDVL